MRLTASKLRQDIYRLLDQVLETGIPLEIERRGQVLRIVPEVAKSKLANLVERPEAVTGDPLDLCEVEWSDAWQPHEA